LISKKREVNEREGDSEIKNRFLIFEICKEHEQVERTRKKKLSTGDQTAKTIPPPLPHALLLPRRDHERAPLGSGGLCLD
jgi:hypothetical protein